MGAIPDRTTLFTRGVANPPTWQSRPFSRMAAQPAAQRPRSCLLVGFWGVPNFGDEWLLRCAQAFTREWLPDNRLTVMVRSSALERRLGQHRAGIRLLDGFFPDPRFFRSLPALIGELGRSDITLIGGGGLINDSYTAASIPRYSVPALMSVVRGVPVVWWGLGVVAPRGRLLRRLAFATLRLSIRVLVRDRDSLRQLRAEGVDAQLSDDLSALSPPTPNQRNTSERVLVVNFRDHEPALAAGRLSYVAASRRHFDRIVLLAAEPGDEALYRLLLATLDLSEPGAGVEILPASDYAGIQRELTTAALVVSERLHVSLFALGAGAPTIVLSYEGKVDAVVGRLHPRARITARDAFWRDDAVRRGAVPSTATVAAVSPASLTAQLAAELTAAIDTRPAASDRLVAALWLAALLLLGALAAAAIWAKRRLLRAATAGRTYAPTATTFAIDGTPAASIANRR